VTFFHEFGHIMHGLCSEGDGNSTHLAKCPRDFVEAPSQMLENWCWQPAVLKRLSRHYETGEALPDKMREAMLAAKNVHASVGITRQVTPASERPSWRPPGSHASPRLRALRRLRSATRSPRTPCCAIRLGRVCVVQVYLASLDLAIHARAPPTSAAELQALVDRMRPEITGVANPPGANFLRSFGHLMNQYSAAYYGYMWAEVRCAPPPPPARHPSQMASTCHRPRATGGACGTLLAAH
jgi:Zn-dependent oligopeptidase